MTSPNLRQFDGITRVMVKIVLVALSSAALVGLALLVLASPVLIGKLYGRHGDFSMQASLGEAYGAASALLAALALGAVCVSLSAQQKRARRDMRNRQRDRVRQTVMLALAEPAYAQCWGSRFSPDTVDERLFFYTNLIVLDWSYAWEDGDLTEVQARQFLRSFFDSEVPRMYWERHGDWHHPRLTLTRSDRFIAMMNEEYLRAIKGGPPSRCHSPMSACSFAAAAEVPKAGVRTQRPVAP
jgi:hypothetical protein